ncbi:hypothetical protein BWI93_11210 [Siphonobacter sp. BAB-5385]|uniref:DUF4249 domain-containing protein n=1 Tax=unclassified Siphonobacter TaxID=2635712 RepID=UPI000B9E12C3|nr:MULTISPECIES: DUF4249 domain-containing protein [unclassified Siphonobacter]OZI08067.1 hypothetical protein BWI93_11210 [Siphonobacter sp. BAB-5385]PMD96781.1 hypothetical protein BWI97_11475 [Siphonobacter sp. BAB-5405]
MKTKRLLLALLGMSSCTQELNDLSIESDRKLVIECYLNPASPDIRVLVKQTKPIQGAGSGDRSPGPSVTNANVLLSDGKQQIRIPFDDNSDQYRLEAVKYKLVAGRSYTLRVSAKGFPETSASCTIPKPMSTLQSRDGKLTYIPDDNKLFKVYKKRTLSWNITQTNATHYYLVGSGEGKLTPVQLNGRDSAVVALEKTQVVAFLTNTGKSISTPQLDFLLGQARKVNDPQIISEAPVYTFVYHVDPNYYQFMESVKLQREVGDNPFAEPVPIYTNIKNGLGIFGAAVVHVKKLEK